MSLQSLRVGGKPVDDAHLGGARPERHVGTQGAEHRESIAALFSRAVTDGKEYAAAQVEVVKQTAVTGAEKGGVGVGLVAGAGFLAYAGLIAFLVALVIWLEDMIGPIGAGLAVLVGVLVISFILFKMGMGKIKEATAAISGKRK